MCGQFQAGAGQVAFHIFKRLVDDSSLLNGFASPSNGTSSSDKRCCQWVNSGPVPFENLGMKVFTSPAADAIDEAPCAAGPASGTPGVAGWRRQTGLA